MHEFTQQSMRSLFHLTRFVSTGVTHNINITWRRCRVYHHQTETKHTQELDDLFAPFFQYNDSLGYADIHDIRNLQAVDCL